MNEPRPARRVVSFGVYQCDIFAGELRKNGIKVKISDQPFRLLTALLERPGEMITRQELGEHLWPEGTFVGFEDSLNTAVNKLRTALDDESENPRFIETIPRRGYRFIGAADETDKRREPRVPVTSSEELPQTSSQTKRGRHVFATILLTCASLVILGLADWFLRGRPALSFNSQDGVLITDFENQTGDPRFDYALGTAFKVSLEQSHHVNVFPHDQLTPILQMMGKDANERITRGVGREICQRENIRGLVATSVIRTGQQYELVAQLIDPQTDETVRSYSERSYGEDHLLDALDKIAGEVRRDLGESLYQIHKSQMPLAQVTTPSLQALKDYSNGKLLWHAAKYGQAVADFKTAVAADPQFAMANAALGNACYSFVYNDYSDGQKYFETALANESRVTPRERQVIETEYAEDRGHIAEARQFYERYLQEYPDDLDMRFNYARLLRMNGNPAQGIEQDRQILRISPNDAHSYIDMATAYHTLGELSQSLDAYNKAFQIDPHIRVAGNISREYGFTLVQDGQIGEAQQFFSGFLSDSRFEELGARSLALLDLYRGQYKDGQRYLERALQIDTANKETFSIARVRYLMAEVAAGEGRKDDQIAQLDLIMANFSALQTKVAYGSLVGRVYARAGEAGKAEDILDRITPLVDTHSQEQSSYLNILRAEIADTKNQTGQALHFLQAVSDDATGMVLLKLDALGRIYQADGNVDQAIVSYEKLLSMPSGCAGWEPQQDCLRDRYTLAEDYAQKGEKEKAARTIEAFLSLWKGADADLPLNQKALQLRSSLLREQ